MQLVPKVEVAFDTLQKEIFLVIMNESMPEEQSKLYGDFSAELFELRDRYRHLLHPEKKASAPVVGATEADNKPSDNDYISSLAETRPVVKFDGCTFNAIAPDTVFRSLIKEVLR